MDKEGHLKLNILAHIQLKPISEATDQSLTADLQTFINDIQKLDSALKLLKSVTHNQITKVRICYIAPSQRGFLHQLYRVEALVSRSSGLLAKLWFKLVSPPERRNIILSR